MENNGHNLTDNPASGVEAAQMWQPELPVGNVIVGKTPERPLWLSTAGYLLIALTASLSLFFIVWGLLHDGGEGRETSWIPAGIAAFIIMFIAVIAREVVLRRVRTQYLLKYDQFGAPLPPPAAHSKPKVKSKKFTLEENAAALVLIQRLSDEANSSVATAEKHLEAFKACQEYLEIAESELNKVHLSSPRLPALKNGQEGVKVLHKHHLLNWAAEETRRMTREAAVMLTLDEKIESANKALETLNFALQFYPQDEQLLDSLIAVREFINSLRIADWIENAERAAFKGNYPQAIDLYQDALFYLQRETLFDSLEHDSTVQKLNEEIDKLRSLMSSTVQKKPRKRYSPRHLS